MYDSSRWNTYNSRKIKAILITYEKIQKLFI